MAELQESDYGDGRDYTVGSPHLAHASLRERIECELTSLVASAVSTNGSCKVVEIGAGHGTFTETLVAAGAEVIVTEMSGPSAAVLSSKFANVDQVRIVHDQSGELSRTVVDDACDLVVMISVLHHIPDYLSLVESLTVKMRAGGAFYCTQDPTWYPERSRALMMVDRGSYLLWRLGQGNFRRGLSTRVRRLKGAYEDNNPSDMVEYHVVRKGVNQNDLRQLLTSRFEDVVCRTFWTTQSAILQRVGDLMGWQSTFSIIARRRRA